VGTGSWAAQVASCRPEGTPKVENPTRDSEVGRKTHVNEDGMIRVDLGKRWVVVFYECIEVRDS
jgi:hypothetical protein